MEIKKVFVLLITTFTVTGCITEFHATLAPDESSMLFVEGNIVENTEAVFYLSRNFPMDSATAPDESLDIQAELYIIDSNGNKSQPASYLGMGAYQASVGALDDNVEYGIQIAYNGEIYQSTLSKPLFTPEIDSLSWLQTEEKGPVSIRISTHHDKDGENFFLWTYDEDWEYTVDFPTTVFYDTLTRNYYEIWPAPYQYCWRSFQGNSYFMGSMDKHTQQRIVNKELYQIESRDERLSVLYSVHVVQQAISRKAFEYYHSFKELNEAMGGLFTPQPTSIDGNVTCVTNPAKRVVGYVEVIKNITHKRLFVDRNHLTRPLYYDDCDEHYANRLADIVSLPEFCKSGYRPATNIETFFWAYTKCTDCRRKGGSKEKPDFWPNSHQ